MKQKWLTRIGNLFLILSIIFIFITLRKQDIQFKDYFNNTKEILVYILIIFIYVVSVYINSEVYFKIISLFSKNKIMRNEIQQVYIASNLAKYLPGNVMHYVGRNVLGSKYSISQANLIVSTILELILLIGMSGVMIFIFSYKYITFVCEFLIKERFFITIALLILFVVILLFVSFQFYKHKNKIIEKINEIGSKNIKILFIKCIPLNFIVQFSTSITYVLVLLTLSEERKIFSNITMIFNVLGIYLIAWLVGFLVPGAPGGIGIKEYILVLLLGSFFPKDIILVSVILHRCLNVFSEIIAFVIMKIDTRLKILINGKINGNEKIGKGRRKC